MKFSLIAKIIILLSQCALYWAADCQKSRVAVRNLNRQKTKIYRIGLSESDNPDDLIILSMVNSLESQKGQTQIGSGYLTFVEKTGEVYEYKLNNLGKAKLSLKKANPAKNQFISVRVSFTHRRFPYPRMVEFMFGSFSCTVPKFKPPCKQLSKPCEEYKFRKSGQSGVEHGNLALPVNPWLRNWEIEVGFESEVNNLQLNQKANIVSQDCKKIFTFKRPPQYRPWISFSRRMKGVLFPYTLAFDANTVTPPKITYIFYGNKMCNTSCGTKPQCRVTTVAPPVTEQTTQAPPPVEETTTEAPPVGETTTVAPPPVEETTTEAPPPVEETTTEAPVPTTTEEPITVGETTTESPPVVETTTEEPITVGETTTELPPVAETTTEAPITVGETTTELPPVVDTTTEEPITVVETTTESPPIVDTTTEAPITVGETTTESPSVATTTTEEPITIGETTTVAPTVVTTTELIEFLDEADFDIFDDFV